VTLLRCVVFAWACEVSRVRPSAGASRRPCLNLDSHITPLKSQHIESEMVKLKSEPFDDLSRGTQNTPSNRVAFMKPVPEVDKWESSEGKTMETPSMQRTRLIAGEVAAAVTPIAKLRPEEEPATAKTRYRPGPSSSQRTLGQLPDDDGNPTQVDSPSVIPATAPVTVVPTTPRRNRTAPSTLKRMPGSQTSAKRSSCCEPLWCCGDRTARDHHRHTPLAHSTTHSRSVKYDFVVVL
jgi:hypothetical protein